MEETMDKLKKEYEETEADESLAAYRSTLSSTYAYRENEIPEAFDRIRKKVEEKQDNYEGYRVQIYSGQDVQAADTIAADFRVWADTTITGYQPQTYVFFRTPYYRVHVGDFHERDQAIQFSNMVKRFDRDAWVVYDRVEPANVPADSVEITFQVRDTAKATAPADTLDEQP